MTLADLDKLEARFSTPGFVRVGDSTHDGRRVVALCQWARRALEAMKAVAVNTNASLDKLSNDTTVVVGPVVNSPSFPCLKLGDLRRLDSVYRELTEEPHP